MKVALVTSTPETDWLVSDQCNHRLIEHFLSSIQMVRCLTTSYHEISKKDLDLELFEHIKILQGSWQQSYHGSCQI